MEKKYINESRYKKGTARKRRDYSTVHNKLKQNNNITQKNNINTKGKDKTKIKKKIRLNIAGSRGSNIAVCIILLILIAIISRVILKDDNEPFIPFPFFEDVNEYVITIGIITNDDLLASNSKNVLINELKKYSKDMLLEVNEDYSITYKCISDVIKNSNNEYIIKINNKSNVSVNDVKLQLDNYRNDNDAIYYTKLRDIDSVDIIDDNSIRIKLKRDLPYFIYNLDICLTTSKDINSYVQQESSSSNRLILVRHKSANKQLPAKIIVIKYPDMYKAVEAYKNKEINMFVTNAENVTNILGKYEYNIQSYKNGKTVFLLGNPKSNIFARQEVRKAIAYSIDREGIINDVLKSKGDKIDLPYIYDNVKYKYDVYAAENLLLTNGYKKTNKIYTKIEKGEKTTLELDMLVNKQDVVKVGIANKIKNNLSAIGIKVNVEKLTESQIGSRLKNSTYDLILASVDLNNTPDISFVENMLFMTQDINKELQNIQNSTIQDLNKNIYQLQNSLSNNISSIGIYADISYLVYSKEIIGMDKTCYMNLLKGILTVQ